MTSPRLVLLGATGFIGRPLVRALVGKGYELVLVSRDPDRIHRIFGDNVTSVGWDGRSPAGFQDHIDGAYGIVNLVGENLSAGRWTEARRDAILQSRLRAGLAVVEAVREAGKKPRVLVQASAIGYYGSRGDDVLGESSARGDGFLAQVVEAWEDSTREVEALGLRRVVCRSAVVLGKDGGALPLMLRPFRLFVGGPLGAGQRWFSWIHLDDEVRAIIFLLENSKASGIYNFASPGPLKQRDFARACGRVLRRPSLVPVPSFLLRVLFGQKADETLLVSQRVLPKRLQDAGFSFRFPESLAALKDILG